MKTVKKVSTFSYKTFTKDTMYNVILVLLYGIFGTCNEMN